MGYLGLSEPIEKEDNLFTRLFWPSDHAGEADSLGQQGFWICMAVAVVSGFVLFLQGHTLIALLTFAFFGLGGMGIREHSVPAAALVAVAYVLDLIAAFLSGRSPGFFGLVATVLLIANIRGTWIASKWAKLADPDSFPERLAATWRDRLVDQLPAQIWPGSRIAFFCIAALYLFLSVAGTISLGLRLARSTPPTPSTSQQTEVAAPR